MNRDGFYISFSMATLNLIPHTICMRVCQFHHSFSS
nr:MAG TPA: hypothetical protein [Caudoviricetes sp.]